MELSKIVKFYKNKNKQESMRMSKSLIPQILSTSVLVSQMTPQFFGTSDLILKRIPQFFGPFRFDVKRTPQFLGPSDLT